jgi:hypothetical protein
VSRRTRLVHLLKQNSEGLRSWAENSVPPLIRTLLVTSDDGIFDTERSRKRGYPHRVFAVLRMMEPSFAAECPQQPKNSCHSCLVSQPCLGGDSDPARPRKTGCYHLVLAVLRTMGRFSVVKLQICRLCCCVSYQFLIAVLEGGVLHPPPHHHYRGMDVG